MGDNNRGSYSGLVKPVPTITYGEASKINDAYKKLVQQGFKGTYADFRSGFSNKVDDILSGKFKFSTPQSRTLAEILAAGGYQLYLRQKKQEALEQFERQKAEVLAYNNNPQEYIKSHSGLGVEEFLAPSIELARLAYNNTMRYLNNLNPNGSVRTSRNTVVNKNVINRNTVNRNTDVNNNFNIKAFQNWVLLRNKFWKSRDYDNNVYSLGKSGVDGIMGKYTRNAYNALKNEYNKYLKSGMKNYSNFYDKYIYKDPTDLIERMNDRYEILNANSLVNDILDTTIPRVEFNPVEPYTHDEYVNNKLNIMRQYRTNPTPQENNHNVLESDMIGLKNTTLFKFGGMIPKYLFGAYFVPYKNDSGVNFMGRGTGQSYTLQGVRDWLKKHKVNFTELDLTNWAIKSKPISYTEYLSYNKTLPTQDKTNSTNKFQWDNKYWAKIGNKYKGLGYNEYMQEFNKWFDQQNFNSLERDNRNYIAKQNWDKYVKLGYNKPVNVLNDVVVTPEKGSKKDSLNDNIQAPVLTTPPAQTNEWETKYNDLNTKYEQVLKELLELKNPTRVDTSTETVGQLPEAPTYESLVGVNTASMNGNINSGYFRKQFRKAFNKALLDGTIYGINNPNGTQVFDSNAVIGYDNGNPIYATATNIIQKYGLDGKISRKDMRMLRKDIIGNQNLVRMNNVSNFLGIQSEPAPLIQLNPINPVQIDNSVSLLGPEKINPGIDFINSLNSSNLTSNTSPRLEGSEDLLEWIQS